MIRTAVNPPERGVFGDASIDKGKPKILVVNRGSSSIRFAVYAVAEEQGNRKHVNANDTGLLITPPILAGKIDRVGTSKYSKLRLTLPNAGPVVELPPADSVATQLLVWLETQGVFASVQAVGHRIVHGMNRSKPQLITPELLEALENIAVFAPLHLPLELELINAIASRRPDLPQVACFDTAFHQTMPRVASQLPLPRSYEAHGLRRYGFHGLSCEYLMQALETLGDPTATNGRVILAHLGSGGSLTAVLNGKSIDNSMGFTPAGGLMMGTRTGDIDPGILSYLLRTEKLTLQQIDAVINHESGLLGVSQLSADIRDLLAAERSDTRAAEAINLFCYQTVKWVGAFSAALGGLDTLVFSGGIGENAPEIRARICAGLAFLGVQIDVPANAQSAGIISATSGKVAVRVIPTDEEYMIARNVYEVVCVKAG